MRRKIILPVAKITVILAAVASLGYASRLVDREPSEPAGYRIPACQSEDSPSCVWTDPDTDVDYVHGYDADMSIEDRTGIPWCVTPVQVKCLDVRQ